MSIPPLVCSTPPPPDQCEEDKDPDDFDIPYNLSQDDDDDDAYGYGDFSSYNHYQPNCTAQTKETVTKNEEEISIETQSLDSINKNKLRCNEDHNNSNGASTITEIRPKSDEDTNVEDLGLEVNEEPISLCEKEDDISEAEKCNVEISVKGLEVAIDTTDENNTQSSPTCDDNEVRPTNRNCNERLEDGPLDDASLDLDSKGDLNVQYSEPNSSSNDECKDEVIVERTIEPMKESSLDDDFEDFDDFQFVSKEKKISDIFENCDNPWETNEAGSDDFGNFTANFEAVDKQMSPISKESTDIAQNDSKCGSIEEDDDFGDFDDFKSSAVEDETMEVSADTISDQHLPVLNFHTSDNEHQVMESITKVLTSVFEEEILEPDNEFEGKLESMLSETWGHLRETDVRQPYIINWNNSLGQKTLLRALCIDSRNILFGPKWGYNMPKYAVNLSAAPLQPQKPLTPSSSSQSEPVTTEKTITKPGGWTDPFIADGQQFTYAEALLLDLEHLMATLDQMAHNNSTLKISELLSHACNTETESVVEVTPTDLDVFEAAVANKSDKIYSSTLNIQPLRQISLPDTHIFTPTDSETPTSKTVHYDSGPSILLPQTVLESNNKSESSIRNTNIDLPKDDDDDYWEFQDFKSSSEKSAPSPATQTEPPLESKPDNVVLKSNVTYQSQVLLPIRMEPQIPTVNWPDPGEIKETFDDFSDFVSNSSWTDKPQEQITIPHSGNESTVETNVLDKINDKHKNVPENEGPKLNNEDFDDDFDTFQSALPPKHIVSDFKFDSLGANNFNNIPSQNLDQAPEFNNAFPNISSAKSEVISVNNPTRPNEALQPNMGYISKTPERPSNKNSVTLGNTLPPTLLQPISTSSNVPSSQSKQKTGQILQPLSLESYSQINWPNPGIDLQDLSRFNPVETLQSLKSDLNVGGPSKISSPVHNQKNANSQQAVDEDIWGEFVSSKPKQQATSVKKPTSFADDDEWTDFVSSPSVKPQNGLNTISLNVHTNIQKSGNLNKFSPKNNQLPLDIPTLNYITPKASGHTSYNDRHFQNL